MRVRFRRRNPRRTFMKYLEKRFTLESISEREFRVLDKAGNIAGVVQLRPLCFLFLEANRKMKPTSTVLRFLRHAGRGMRIRITTSPYYKEWAPFTLQKTSEEAG